MAEYVKAIRKAYHKKKELTEVGGHTRKKWIIVDIPGEKDEEGNPITDLWIDFVFQRKKDGAWKNAKSTEKLTALNNEFNLYTSGGSEQEVVLEKRWRPAGEFNGNAYEGKFKYYTFNYQEVYNNLSKIIGTPPPPTSNQSHHGPQEPSKSPNHLGPIAMAHKAVSIVHSNRDAVYQSLVDTGALADGDAEQFYEHLNRAVNICLSAGVFIKELTS